MTMDIEQILIEVFIKDLYPKIREQEGVYSSENKVGHFYTPTNQLEFVEKVEKSCDQSTMNNRVGMDVEDRWGSAWSATW